MDEHGSSADAPHDQDARQLRKLPWAARSPRAANVSPRATQLPAVPHLVARIGANAMTLSRRRLLTSLLGAPDASPTAANAPTMTQANPGSIDPAEQEALPRVISWLADYIDAPDESPAPLPRADRKLPLLLRPPGAIAEDHFLARCTRCTDCIEACPHDAIVRAAERFRDAAGTPTIDVSTSPCRMCEDFPCIAACETNALVDNADRLGTAHVRRFDCLNELGSPCSTCIERCPVEGAIGWGETSAQQVKTPLVSETRCTGCGVCHFVCPAPVNAIAILPNPVRPPAPNEDNHHA